VDSELLERYERVEGEQVKCAVCFEALSEKAGEEDGEVENSRPVCPLPSNEVLALPCHHAFHAACLHPWLATQTTCPTCRFDIDPSSLSLSPPPIQPGDRYRPYPSAEQRTTKKWSLPEGASKKTLREIVREKEQEQGWICSEPNCLHTVPDKSGTKPELIHLVESLDMEHATPICEHAYHPECLVGAVHSELKQAPGGVWLECEMCRNGRGGWVSSEQWDEGVKGWDAV